MSPPPVINTAGLDLALGAAMVYHVSTFAFSAQSSDHGNQASHGRDCTSIPTTEVMT